MDDPEAAGAPRPPLTAPAEEAWPATPAGLRRSEVHAVVGTGDGLWRRATHDVLRWRVKTASGFRVDAPDRVRAGQRLTVVAPVLGCAIREPVEVVAVVEQPGRVGFAYRTLPGHPVDGEEAFIVTRDGDTVRIVVRSLTRAAPQQPWRLVHPLLRLAQTVVRRRYLRALR